MNADRSGNSAETLVIRPYRPEDRDAIRKLCCETGFLGEPIYSIFSDRKAFADYLTRYYTDWEPESTWVGAVGGEVVGYLTACKRWRLNKIWSLWIGLRLTLHAFAMLIQGKYDSKDREFMKWILNSSWREAPTKPGGSAHFHFNARKEFRGKTVMRNLMLTMLADMKRHRVPCIYGQMVTYANKRSDRLFEYLGWKVYDKKRITKYQSVFREEIYLTTIVCDLTQEVPALRLAPVTKIELSKETILEEDAKREKGTARVSAGDSKPAPAPQAKAP
ncbi:MAG: GNAT family N-acetyltransferase [Verrucomicrobiae bacterium]|nr:GNAT family N-acetyltransferase [Verrucomicrobiae bacterium]